MKLYKTLSHPGYHTYHMVSEPTTSNKKDTKGKGCCSHLFFVIFSFFLVMGLQNLIGYQKLRWALGWSEQTHMFVVSAFYYNTSKRCSLPPNTIAIVYGARKHAPDFPVTCVSTDAFGTQRRSAARTDMALVAPVQCKWTTMVALCPTVRNPVQLRVEAEPGTAAEIPFKGADRQPRQFVVCMSRMFLFEHWQLLVAALETYRFYGADLVVTYVESVLTDIHRLLRGYEREGVVALRAAMRMFRPPDLDYDPNAENEWYNQDFGYNSCLYEFKESAEFMLIADWDDVLVPEHHRNYADEMRWLMGLKPNAAAFVFQRPQTTIHAAHSPRRFDLRAAIDAVEVDEGARLTGKFAGRPADLDGVWLHAPSRVRAGREVVALGPEHSRAYHFRRWRFDEKELDLQNRTFLADGRLLAHNFEQFLSRNNLTSTFHSLPSAFVYYDRLVQCYAEFASRLSRHSFGCPSLPKCALPTAVHARCTVLRQRFVSRALLNGFHVHHSALDEFVERPDGCV